MSIFIPELGPATDPNRCSPPDPVYVICDCGRSLEDARYAAVDRGAGLVSAHMMEIAWLCDCGRWYHEFEATP
jgi:CDGSH-type Zn-finger protein